MCCLSAFSAVNRQNMPFISATFAEQMTADAAQHVLLVDVSLAVSDVDFGKHRLQVRVDHEGRHCNERSVRELE